MSEIDPTRDFAILLVTGEMRSGTTLVANFINNQPGCLIYADFLKGWLNEPQKLKLPSLSAQLNERQKNVLLSSLVAAGWQFGVTAFECIQRIQFNNFFELFQIALGNLDPQGGTSVIGVKITRQYQLLPELLELGVKVIFCLRDPRDVVLSAKNRFSDYNLFKTTLDWKEALKVARACQPNPHFLIVKFESLIDENHQLVELQRLSEFLGLPLDRDIITLSMREGIPFTSNTSFGDITHAFDPQALYRWEKYPSSPEVVFASRFLKDEIRNFGYKDQFISQTSYHPIYVKYAKYATKRKIKDFLLMVYRNVLN